MPTNKKFYIKDTYHGKMIQVDYQYYKKYKAFKHIYSERQYNKYNRKMKTETFSTAYRIEGETRINIAREIMGVFNSQIFVFQHVQGLNYCKKNLFLTTKIQKKLSSKTKIPAQMPKYLGVYYDAKRAKYYPDCFEAQIRLDRDTQYSLGYFDSPEIAFSAYQVGLELIKRDFYYRCPVRKEGLHIQEAKEKADALVDSGYFD